AAFPSGIALIALLLFLLRVLRRRARAGTDAKLANLEKAATTDPLTGLRNRRTFDDDLSQALAKGRVCLVMLDLDGLKQTNERLGHAVGDERIRAVSAALRAASSTSPRSRCAAGAGRMHWPPLWLRPSTPRTAAATTTAARSPSSRPASPSSWGWSARRSTRCASPASCTTSATSTSTTPSSPR